MVDRFDADGTKVNPTYDVFTDSPMKHTFPALDEFSERWSQILGREVNFAGYPDVPAARHDRVHRRRPAVTGRPPHGEGALRLRGLEVHTALNRDAIFRRVSAALPQLTWRRGGSETQGRLTVWGRNEQGASVRFSLAADDVDVVCCWT